MVLGFGQCVVFHLTTLAAAFLCVCVVNMVLLSCCFCMTLHRGLKRPQRRHKSDSGMLQIDPGMRAERGNVD